MDRRALHRGLFLLLVTAAETVLVFLLGAGMTGPAQELHDAGVPQPALHGQQALLRQPSSGGLTFRPVSRLGLGGFVVLALAHPVPSLLRSCTGSLTT
ncbi:hypothetical protein ACFWP3_05320 [Streptomyces sp. NPDC058525]|uniref:hypothetical protein n=1 Tax=unclassified Streptomyces TaxID=2593676 RepID=UPI00366335E9